MVERQSFGGGVFQIASWLAFWGWKAATQANPNDLMIWIMTTKSLEVLLELKKGWGTSQHIKNNKETSNQEIMLQNFNQDSAICISQCIPL